MSARINFFRINFFVLIFASIFLLGNTRGELLERNIESSTLLKKITFDISTTSGERSIDSPPDRLRAVNYEFCVPKESKFVAEVKAIDSSIMFHGSSRGRIGCSENQYLCIGTIQSPQWKEILLSLARLDYVERIDQFFGE